MTEDFVGRNSLPPFLWREKLPSHTTKPKKKLWLALFQGEWDTARLRLTLYPGDVFYIPGVCESPHESLMLEDGQRESGVTCLHVACRRVAPLDILRRLLELYPQQLLLQDKAGWTAMHKHILHGSVGTVGNPTREAEFFQAFQMLLAVSPWQALSLRPYTNATISPISNVASIHADNTGAPLHLFCYHGHDGSSAELALVKILLEADASQVTRADPNGCFPGTLLWRLYRNRYRRFTDDTSGNTKDPTGQVLEILFYFLAACRGDFCPEQHTLQDVLIYQAKYAGPDCTDFVRLYMQVYPASTCKWDKGKLPVHVAAGLWPRPLTSPLAMSVWALAPTTSATVVDPLWRLVVPETAQYVDRNQQRLPLHHALVAPLAVLEMNSTTAQEGCWTPPESMSDDVGLQALVKAYPPALVIPDPVTGLPAAALAASVASMVPVASETALVGFVYGLLRTAPCVLPSSHASLGQSGLVKLFSRVNSTINL